jgi:hypothetical protein
MSENRQQQREHWEFPLKLEDDHYDLESNLFKAVDRYITNHPLTLGPEGLEDVCNATRSYNVHHSMIVRL